MLAKEKTILVTGGTGFIGSYLLRYLVQQDFKNIRAIRRANSPMDLVADIQNKVKWYDCDVLDVPALEEAMTDVQQVYHCAGLISFSKKSREKMYKVNEEGTANVVNLANDLGVEKVLHLSSIAALGRSKKGETINEKSHWQNSNYNSHYAISKYLAEMQVWRAIEEGLNAVIVNPSLVLGGGFWGQGTGEIFPIIKKGLKFFPAGGTGLVDVRDVAKYMILLMNSEIQSQRFILNADNLSFQSLFEKISNEMGLVVPKFRVSGFLNEIAWRAEWLKSFLTGKEPIINSETARITAQSFFYENNRSLKNFNFRYTPVEQTIAETSALFLSDFEKGKKAGILPLL